MTEWRDGGYGILCGSVGSESTLVRVQSGSDVVFDVVENQFLVTWTECKLINLKNCQDLTLNLYEMVVMRNIHQS